MGKKKVVESVPGQVSGWMDVKAVLRIAYSNGKMCYQNIQKQKDLPAKNSRWQICKFGFAQIQLFIDKPALNRFKHPP